MKKQIEIFGVAPDSGVLMQRERSAHRKWDVLRDEQAEHLNEQSSLLGRKQRRRGAAHRQRSFIGLRHQSVG